MLTEDEALELLVRPGVGAATKTSVAKAMGKNLFMVLSPDAQDDPAFHAEVTPHDRQSLK